MNFFGLGFTFRSRDEGLLDQQASVSKGFLGMTTAYDRFNKRSGRGFNLLKDKGIKRAEGVLAALRAELGRTRVTSSKYDKVMGKIVKLHGDMRLAKGIKKDQWALQGLRQELQKVPKDSKEYIDLLEKMEEKEQEIFDKREQLSSRHEKLTKRVGHSINVMAGFMQDAGQNNLNLTTNFEAELQRNEKMARQVALNYGYTGKMLDHVASKATSLSIELNMGADETTRALRAWEEAQRELTAVGFKGAKEVAKFSSVTGVQAERLADITRRMSKELGFEDAQLKMVMGTFTKFGQETGNVSGALDSMPGILDTLAKRAADAGHAMNKMQLAQMGTQVAALARGLHATGSSQEESLRFAQEMASHLVDAQNQIGKMFAGTETDLPALAEGLAIGIGDANEAFKLMNEGPEQFTTGLYKMVAAAKKNGALTGQQLDFLRQHLASAFGDDMAVRMVNFFNSTDASVLKSMSDVKQTTSALGKLGNEGYRTGRTLAESFQLTQDRFVASFRSISRVEARNFVRDTGKEFGRFSGQLKKMAGEDGPLGMLVRKFSEMHQIGYLALIPQTLRPMVSLFGGILKEILPLLPGIAVLGTALSMLASPIGLIIAGLAAAGGLIYWFTKTTNAGQKMSKTLGAAWEWLGKKLSGTGDFIHNIATQIRAFAAKIPTFFKQMSPQIVAAFKKLLSFVVDVAPDVLDAIWSLSVAMMEGVTTLAKEGLNALGKWIADANFGDMIAEILPSWDTIRRVGAACWSFIGDAFTTFLTATRLGIRGVITFFKDLGRSGKEIWDYLIERVKEFGRWLEDKVLSIPRKILEAFSSVKTKLAGMWSSNGEVTVRTSAAPPGTPGTVQTPAGRPAAAFSQAQAQVLIEAVHWPRWYQEYRKEYALGVDRIVTMLNTMLPAKERTKTRFKHSMMDEIGLNHLLSSDTVGNPR